ncbi:MAG: tRNA (adenine-N1)-methyltransferase [Micrococcaceae bacterium]
MSPIGTKMRRGPFKYGDKVQLTSEKKKIYTVDLMPGARFNTEKGYLDHDAIAGKDEGIILENSTGVQFMALRPLLSDFVLSMPRGATVVYPKDAGQIITMGDIFPGAKVIEAGVGSGALTLSLLRAVGESGEVHSFEMRDEFAEIARGNIKSFFGKEHPAWKISIGNLAEILTEKEETNSVDRVVLDMLAPWECVEACLEVMRPGGVFLAYVATATQLSRVTEELRATKRFTEPQAYESMVRGWHVDGLAVRPDHRMVAHTGFIVQARKLADGYEPLPKKVRKSKTEFSQEDMNAWVPDDLGYRQSPDRKLRKIVRIIKENEQKVEEVNNNGDKEDSS